MSNETNRVSIVGDDNVGVLCPGVEVKMVDPAGRELPLGSTGLIRIRSDALVPGYNNDLVATASRFVDGWFHNSDLGTMPDAGKLVVLGRADDVLVVGGQKIAPLEIEDRIKRLDGLSDAPLFGIDDADGRGVLAVAMERAADQPPPDLAQQLAAILAR